MIFFSLESFQSIQNFPIFVQIILLTMYLLLAIKETNLYQRYFIFLTEGKNTGVNDIGEKEQHCGPDGRLTPEVSHDRDTPHQADGPVDDHAQAAEEHRSKPVPVAACKLYVSSMKILPDSVCLKRYLLFLIKTVKTNALENDVWTFIDSLVFHKYLIIEAWESSYLKKGIQCVTNKTFL